MDSTNRKTPYHSHRLDTFVAKPLPGTPQISKQIVHIHPSRHYSHTHNTTQTNFQTKKQASKQTSSSCHSEGLCVPLWQVQTGNNQKRNALWSSPKKRKELGVVHNSNTWRSFLKMWDQLKITYYIVAKVSSLPSRRANTQGFQQERKTATRQKRGRKER
jgi:hypothetical protein